MANGSDTLDDLLNAVIARLVQQIPECQTSNTFLCMDAWDVPGPSSGRYIVAVAPLAGSFPEGNTVGGGEEDLRVQTGFDVVIHSALVLDQPKRETAFFTDQAKGVIQMMTAVLRALTNWTPVDSNGSHLVADAIAPTTFSFGRKKGSKTGARLGSAGIEWHLSFDWDLS